MENLTTQDLREQDQSNPDFFLEVQFSKKVKDESEESIKYAKHLISEREENVQKILKDNEKLKKEVSELQNKCGNLKMQRSLISTDILEMRRIADGVKDSLETMSKSVYLTKCEEEEYKNIIEKLEIKKIFIGNTLREKMKNLEEDSRQKVEKMITDKELKMEKLKVLQEKYSELKEKVNNETGKVETFEKNKENKVKERVELEEKLMKIKNENKELQDCYDRKLKEKEQILEEIKENEDVYQENVKKIDNSIEEFLKQEGTEEKISLDLRNQLSEIKKEKSDNEKRIEEINMKSTNLHLHLEKLNQSKEELEEKIRKDIEILNNEAPVINEELQHKMEELNQLKESNSKIQQDHLFITETLETELNDKRKIEEELHNLQNAVNCTGEEVKNIEKENETISQEILNTQRQIENLQIRLNTFKNDADLNKTMLEEKQNKYNEDFSEFDTEVKNAINSLNLIKSKEDEYTANYMKDIEKIKNEHITELKKIEEEKHEVANKEMVLNRELKKIDDECNVLTEINRKYRIKVLELSWGNLHESELTSSRSSSAKNTFESLNAKTPQKKRKFDDESDSSSVNLPTMSTKDLISMYSSKSSTTRNPQKKN